MSRCALTRSDRRRFGRDGARRHRPEASCAQPARWLPKASPRPAGTSGSRFACRGDDCAMNRRTVLTELGADRRRAAPGGSRSDPVRSRPRRAAGGFLRADRRSRTSPRDCANTPAVPCSSTAIPAMGLILAANPHRVFISRLGRIEVYQPIPPRVGKKPGRTAHPCAAEASEKRPHPSGDRADPRWLDSLRASLSAASGPRRLGRGPAIRCRPPSIHFSG